MAGENHRKVLGDYFTLQRGTTYKSRLLGQPGPVLLGLATIQRNGGFRTDSLQTYGGESPDKLLVQPGDLYVSLKDVTQSADLLGAVARLPHDHRAGRLTQDTVKLEPKGPGVPLDYLYWLLRTPQYRSYCRAHATGTTNLGLAREDFLAFPAPEPTPAQDRIVRTLDALDGKTELNRRMNETLEAMARALFKSWFVDFDPVRAKADGRDPGLPQLLADIFPDSFEDSELGEVPRGWTVRALDDFLCQRVERCSVSPDTAARPYVPIDCIAPKSLFLTESKPGEEAQSSLTKFYKGDILFGAMRPYFHKVCIAPFDGTTRTTAFVLYPRQADDFAFTTLQLHHPETIDFATRHSTGSTIPYAVWNDSLNTMPVIAPPQDVRKAFNRLMRPVLLRIPEPYFENRLLAALRDTLMPKLISGELGVKDAERFVERIPAKATGTHT